MNEPVGIRPSESPVALHVDVQVEPVLEPLAEPIDPEALQRAASVASRAMTGVKSAEMTLLISDDAQMLELNRTYRGADRTTDVLAFGAREAGQGQQTPFVLPLDSGPVYLGDVVISLPQARRQAEERGHALSSELCLLTVHGTLHLLGYDHVTQDEQRTMWALQRQILAQLGCEEAAPEDES